MKPNALVWAALIVKPHANQASLIYEDQCDRELEKSRQMLFPLVSIPKGIITTYLHGNLRIYLSKADAPYCIPLG